MYAGYQAPGGFFPYMPSPFGLVSQSPTPSVCNEPIYQVSMPNSRCASPGIQMMTPQMSFMNTAMMENRSNMMGNIPMRVEQPYVTNIFQPGASFSDFSESESSIQGGSMSMSPCTHYRITPSYCFPQSDSAPSEYKQSEKHAKQTNLVKSLQRQSFVTDTRWMDDHKQEQNEMGSTSSGWGGSLNPTQTPQDKTIKVYVTAPEIVSVSQAFNQAEAKDDSDSESDYDKGTDVNKKYLIKTVEDVKKEVVRKRKLLLRKQRKKVQNKNKSLHKTELCTHWTLTSTCSFKGKCYFAHGIDELKNRSRGGNYKTQPCVECPVQEGRCLFGSRCNYCHPGEAIRRVVGSSYYDKDYYSDLKTDFSDIDYPFGIFV